jgi:hypothetical protein
MLASKLPQATLIQRIVKNIDPDGIGRRGFLGCLAWAGTGVL